MGCSASVDARSSGVEGPQSRLQNAAAAAAGTQPVSTPGTQIPLGTADQPAEATETITDSTATDEDGNSFGNIRSNRLSAHQWRAATDRENAESGPAVGELLEACASCKVVRDADPLAVVSKGITLRGLRRLAARMRRFFGATWDSVSTAQVNTEFVQAATCAHRCRLAELPSLVDPWDVGVPRYFISHAWKNSFALLLRGIEGFLESADEETHVWIDVIAVNQHTDSGGHQSSDMAAFKHVVASASGGTLVVMDLSSCNPATRAWCVYEWAHTLATHGSDGLHMSLAATDRAALVASLDVSAAECSNMADKERILREVVACHGSVQEFNDKLKLQLLLQPLSYRVDLRRLGGRAKAGGAAAAAATGARTHGSAAEAQGAVGAVGAAGGVSWEWDWSRVEEWLRCPGKGGVRSGGGEAGGGCVPRALCVLAGPGEGKSTVSAALCEASEEASPAAGALKQLAAAGDSGGNGSGGGAPPACVTAYHLIKYSDQRRLDPLKALASLAFQLALRLPGFHRHLLSADIASLVTLNDPEPAFRALIHKPLQKALQEAAEARSALSEQIVILIDALDEADPPSALPSAPAVAVAAATSAADPALRPPPPPMLPVCGNKLFQLLAKQLLSLPPRVRFILTSRPDALGGGVRAALDRLFGPGGVVYMTPGQLRRGSGGRGSGGSGCDSAVGPAAEGGATKRDGEAGDAEAVSTSDARTLSEVERIRAGGCGGTVGTSGANVSLSADATEVSSGVGDGQGDSGGGVLVYHTVIAECFGGNGQQTSTIPKGTEAPAPLAIQQPPPPPAGPPTLSDLYRAYTAVFDAGTASLGLTPSVNGPPPQPPTHGSLGPPRKPSGPSGSPHHAVRQLLSVLLAAQEPLPESLLGSMGLGPRVLSRLPGWPVTFYLEEHHVYTLHKSLGDWLADPRVSGRHAVDLRLGHRLLARRLLAAVERVSGQGEGSGGSGGGDGVEFSSYTLRYLVRHLVAAAEWAPLERLMLQNYAFLAAVFSQGHGHALLRDLLAAPKALAAGGGGGCTPATTAAITDALRWLLGQQHVLVNARSAADVLVNALRAPIRTAVFRAAEEVTLAVEAAVGRLQWRLQHVLGASTGWPALTTTLNTQRQGVRCLDWSPDGSCLATGHQDGVRLWDAGSGECLAELQTPAQEDRRRKRGAVRSLVWDKTETVQSLAWSPDGRTLASGGGDALVRLWDTATGECTAMLEVGRLPRQRGGLRGRQEHKREVSLLAWGPGGRTLLSGAAGGEGLLFWEVAGGGQARCVKQLPLPVKDTFIRCAALAPDGKLLAIGCVRLHEYTIQIYDVDSGCATAKLQDLKKGQGLDPDACTCLAWSPDGSGLAVVWPDRSEVRTYVLCSSKSGPQEPPRLQQHLELRHEEPVVQVVWSPDGKVIASSSYTNVCGRDWQLYSKAAVPSLWSGVVLWSARSGARITTLQDPSDAVTLLAWSPCGGALAVSGEGNEAMRLWDAGAAVAEAEAEEMAAEEARLASLRPAGQRQRQQQQASSQVTPGGGGHTEEVSCLAWRPDGSQLASASEDGSLRIWDAAAGECTAVLRGEEEMVLSVAWSPDGRWLASGGGERAVRIWDAASGKCTAMLKGHREDVYGVAWAPAAHAGASPPGPQQPPRLLASCGGKGELRVWDVTTKACTTLKGHAWLVGCLAWSPDGGCLASGSYDHTVRLWDAAGGTCTAVLEGHSGLVRCVAWAPGGPGSPALLASASYDTTIRLWDAAARTCTTVLQDHSGWITCVSWSPDASHLASSSMDGTVRVWALHRGTGADRDTGDAGHNSERGGGGGGGAGGECVAVLQGHSGSVHCVAWSPDGRTLASGGEDRSIRVYELEALARSAPALPPLAPRRPEAVQAGPIKLPPIGA